MTKKKISSKAETDLKKLNFEQAIGALSEIVEKIETGQVPLEESLQQYEKGMALIGQCRKILQDAEKRIAKIEAKNTSDDQTDELDEEEDEEEEGLF